MALSDFNIKVTIGAETSQFENGLKKVQTQTSQVSSNFSKFTDGIKKSLLKGGAVGLAIAATTTAIKKLSDTIKKSIKLWDEANAAQNKLAQTLKVTGASAWTTTEELNAMADAYQKATNFSSNDVNKMQTVLLGFKNITEDTFKSASDAILDMAEVMGMDLVSATQTVGKALDDPVHGMDSLSRQGFKFSDAEKELIKNLVEAGDAAKAQKIILDELNTTYGGAAEKGVKAATQIKNNWNSLLQEMGRNISMSIDIEPAKKKLNELLEHWKNIQKEMADAKEYSDNIIKAQKAAAEGAATYEQNLLLVEDEIKKIENLRYSYEVAYQNAVEQGWEEEAKYQKEHIDDLNRELKPLQNRKKIIEEVIALEKQQAEAAEASSAAAAAQEQRESSIAALKLKYLKLIAEQEKQWEFQKTVTGQAVDLEEKRNFYQTKLVEIMNEANGDITTANQYYKDQQQIIADITAEIEKQKMGLADISSWDAKILQQEIDRLKVAGEEAGSNGNYNAKKKSITEIYLLTLQQLKSQEEADMKSVEGTANAEEARQKILEYYNGERLKLQRDWNEELSNITKQETEEEWKAKKEAYAKMVNLAKNYATQISSIFSRMAKTIGDVFKGIASFVKTSFSKVTGILGNLFKFDTNDALDKLLKFEDAILTFFVETLPQMPSFLASAFQSIEVLVDTIANNIDFDFIFTQFAGVFTDIAKRLPKLMSNISSILRNLLKALNNMLKANMKDITKGISDILNSFLQTLPSIINMVFETFNNLVLGLQQLDWTSIFVNLSVAIQTFFDNLPATLTALIDTLATIIKGIVDSNLIFTIFDGFGDAICEFLGNEEQIKTFLTSLLTLIGQLAKALLSNAGKIFGALIEALPDILMVILQSLPQLLADIIGGAFEGVIAILKGIINIFIKGVNVLIDGLNWADFFDWFPDVPHIPELATGTDNAKRGLTLVGEAGPELVNFRGGEQVLNAHNTQKALAGMGGNTNEFNVNFYNTKDTSAYALVSELKQYNRQMAINGVL